jgi:hypothetical protein
VVEDPVLEFEVHGAVEGEAVVDADWTVGINALLVGKVVLLLPLHLLQSPRQVELDAVVLPLHAHQSLQESKTLLLLLLLAASEETLGVSSFVDREVPNLVCAGSGNVIFNHDAEDDQSDHYDFLEFHQVGGSTYALARSPREHLLQVSNRRLPFHNRRKINYLVLRTRSIGVILNMEIFTKILQFLNWHFLKALVLQ